MCPLCLINVEVVKCNYVLILMLQWQQQSIAIKSIHPSIYLSIYLSSLKDRVIFHRLEHVCHAIDKGEWPFVSKSYNHLGKDNFSDSRSSTPVPPGTPSECGTPLQDYGSCGTPDTSVSYEHGYEVRGDC